jgi:hypothetical protein
MIFGARAHWRYAGEVREEVFAILPPLHRGIDLNQ